MVAHLTGWDMPRPAPAFTASLRAMDSRLRDCALSHAADAAVAARAPAISRPGQPGRARRPRHCGDAAGRGRRHAGVRGGGTAVPRAAVPVGAGPGRAAGRCPRRGAPPAQRASGSTPTASRSPAAPPPSRPGRWPAGLPATSATPGRRRGHLGHPPPPRDRAGGRLPAPATPAGPPQLAEMLTAFARSPWPRALLRRTPPRGQGRQGKPAAGD